MGTRANFFVGNPADLDAREWLGCAAYDGAPTLGWSVGDFMVGVSSEQDYRDRVATLAAESKTFSIPGRDGWPFPWRDNIFISDYTYAWFNGDLMVTEGDRGWMKFSDWRKDETLDEYRKAWLAPGHICLTSAPAPDTKEAPGDSGFLVFRVQK